MMHSHSHPHPRSLTHIIARVHTHTHTHTGVQENPHTFKTGNLQLLCIATSTCLPDVKGKKELLGKNVRSEWGQRVQGRGGGGVTIGIMQIHIPTARGRKPPALQGGALRHKMPRHWLRWRTRCGGCWRHVVRAMRPAACASSGSCGAMR